MASLASSGIRALVRPWRGHGRDSPRGSAGTPAVAVVPGLRLPPGPHPRLYAYQPAREAALAAFKKKSSSRRRGDPLWWATLSPTDQARTVDSMHSPPRTAIRCATVRRSALSATRDAGGSSHAPGLGSPAAALLDSSSHHCGFHAKRPYSKGAGRIPIEGGHR